MKKSPIIVAGVLQSQAKEFITANEESLVDVEHADVVLIFKEEDKVQLFLSELTKVIPSFGGYELFSRLYPFLRTQKVLYLPRELEQFSTYPLEVIPGFLYLSSRAEANNHKMHREMKITAHLNSDLDHDPIYGNCPRSDELSFNVSRDVTNILPVLNQACDFLKKKHFEGSRVLIVSERCVSRNVAFAIAYLIKYNGMSLQDAWRHLKDVCLPMQPTWDFMQQLAQFEANCRGREEICGLTEEEFYGKRMRQFRIESQIRSALPKND
ncbi:serine/threonine/tyrosine-interacting-like protein 1 [Clonorchis sinensis]|uniref:Serine/threonine/tyrosine-interacting-like protein 1 n=1 Tax=Clonorchis sinensis TaxID=79923 RepID=G7YPU4_CLOSI|nr:serine/threonine/tyrosine-interacting-like protein 1 [Clonorchis sinensis]